MNENKFISPSEAPAEEYIPLPPIVTEADLRPMMSFAEAMKELLLNKRITRDGWNDKRHYILLKDYLLQLHKAGEAEEVTHPWIISEEDLTGEDWVAI